MARGSGYMSPSKAHKAVGTANNNSQAGGSILPAFCYTIIVWLSHLRALTSGKPAPLHIG